LITNLDKTHRPVTLLPETHSTEAFASTEEGSKSILEVGRRMGGRRGGWEVSDVERVDLRGRRKMSVRDLRSRASTEWERRKDETHRWVHIRRIAGSRQTSARLLSSGPAQTRARTPRSSILSGCSSSPCSDSDRSRRAPVESSSGSSFTHLVLSFAEHLRRFRRVGKTTLKPSSRRLSLLRTRERSDSRSRLLLLRLLSVARRKGGGGRR